MKLSEEESEWEEIGIIGVDAGLCWVGDPCYILHRENKPNDIGENWEDFCSTFYEHEDDGFRQYSYDVGHAGLGVCMTTGYGDGVYPVEVRRNKEGRIAELRVIFITEEEE